VCSFSTYTLPLLCLNFSTIIPKMYSLFPKELWVSGFVDILGTPSMAERIDLEDFLEYNVLFHT